MKKTCLQSIHRDKIPGHGIHPGMISITLFARDRLSCMFGTDVWCNDILDLGIYRLAWHI